MGRWDPGGDSEVERYAQHVREMVGASLLMDGLRELEQLRKLWTA